MVEALSGNMMNVWYYWKGGKYRGRIKRCYMDNVYWLIIGAALTAAGFVAYRQGKHVALRAVAAAGFAAGVILFIIGLVNALSGTG